MAASRPPAFDRFRPHGGRWEAPLSLGVTIAVRTDKPCDLTSLVEEIRRSGEVALGKLAGKPCTGGKGGRAAIASREPIRRSAVIAHIDWRDA
jgi:hypothetical protein